MRGWKDGEWKKKISDKEHMPLKIWYGWNREAEECGKSYQSKNIDLYWNNNIKPMKRFKQWCDNIRLSFRKYHSGIKVETGLLGGKDQNTFKQNQKGIFIFTFPIILVLLPKISNSDQPLLQSQFSNLFSSPV